MRIMTYIPLFRSYNRAMKIAKERPYQNFRVYYLVRQDFSAGRLYEDTLDLLVDHNLKTGQDVINYKKEAIGTLAIEQVSRFFELSFEIALICAVFRKTNAKALLTTNGHQKCYASG